MPGAHRLLLAGGLLCVPAAVGIAVFAFGWADADALRGASICATPHLDSSKCMSVFSGKILERHPGGGKALPSVVVSAGGTTTEVGYECGVSPAGACDAMSFAAGENVSTGWWKGALVALGPPGATPRVQTDQSPEDHLGIGVYLLGLVIPAASLLIAGALRRAAPMSVEDLLETAVARTPQPPRPVDSGLVRRVAWGNYVWPLPIVWAALYFVPALPMGFDVLQPRLAPLFLTGAFVVAAVLVNWGLGSYLSDLIRAAARRSVEVRRVRVVPIRGGEQVVISYQRTDGRAGTFALDGAWKGHVEAGDRLDALTNQRSGAIRRVLSMPPTHA